MSEQRTDYDPMSLQAEVDEIYSSQEIIEHIRAARAISQEATRRRFLSNFRMRAVENVYAPELFGEYDKSPEVKPPVSPE